MKQKEDSQEISHVVVRELQAPMVSALIKGFADVIGKAKAFEIAQKVINEDAILSGKTLAEKYSGNSFEHLLKLIQEIWTKDGALKIENISLGDKSLSFNVTHCRYAEIYKKLGIQELGFLMSCSRDYAFLDGFNPDIILIRTRTIMEGYDVCNFHYGIKS